LLHLGWLLENIIELKGQEVACLKRQVERTGLVPSTELAHHQGLLYVLAVVARHLL